MNRAQRRQSAKAKPSARFNREAGVAAFHTRIALSNCGKTTEEDLDIIMIDYMIRLEQITGNGVLDTTGFIQLNEANCFGFCLAARLFKFSANPETAALFTPSQKDFEAAAEALCRAGERYGKTNRYGLDAEGIKALRDSMKWLKELIEITTRDHVLHAMRQAQTMVENSISEQKSRIKLETAMKKQFKMLNKKDSQ